MPQFINTNVASLNTQRALNTSQNALSTSLQRLSSGLRINSAKDDAAGMAITDRMTSQIRGMNQAIRNANDGVSLAQTGEGALAEITNNLQRIRELAVQSANATNSASDRAALDLEVQQLISEIDRTSSQTSFNGRNVIDGSFGSAAFQVGANVGQTISLDLSTSTRTADIGAVATATSVDLSTLITEAVGAVANTSGAAGAFTDVTIADGSTDTYSIVVGGVTIFSETETGTDGAITVTAADIDSDYTDDSAGSTGLGNAAVQTALGVAGITQSGTAAGGDLAFTKTDGTAIDIVVVNDPAANGFAGGDFATGTNNVDNGSAAVAAVSVVLGADELQIQFGTDTAISVAAATYTSQQDLVDAVNVALGSNATASLDADTNVISLTNGEAITIATDTQSVFSAASFALSGNLAATDVLTVAQSEETIHRIDAALTSVTDLRSTFGAIQNRFSSVVSSLQSTVENVSAARSRIQDADFAAETAELTRNQILQQAGIAMLSQANAAPQNVLALLQ